MPKHHYVAAVAAMVCFGCILSVSAVKTSSETALHVGSGEAVWRAPARAEKLETAKADVDPATTDRGELSPDVSLGELSAPIYVAPPGETEGEGSSKNGEAQDQAPSKAGSEDVPFENSASVTSSSGEGESSASSEGEGSASASQGEAEEEDNDVEMDPSQSSSLQSPIEPPKPRLAMGVGKSRGSIRRGYDKNSDDAEGEGTDDDIPVENADNDTAVTDHASTETDESVEDSDDNEDDSRPTGGYEFVDASEKASKPVVAQQPNNGTMVPSDSPMSTGGNKTDTAHPMGSNATSSGVGGTKASQATSFDALKSANTCEDIEYGGEGADCDNVGNRCHVPLVCRKGTCTMIKDGDVCNVDDDCGDVLACIEGHCMVLGGDGDRCSSDMDCASKDCVGNVCKGIAAGAGCFFMTNGPTGTNPCTRGHYCAAYKDSNGQDRHMCKQSASLGAPCRIDASGYNLLDACEPGSICSSTSENAEGVCVKIGGGKEGDTCSSFFGDFACDFHKLSCVIEDGKKAGTCQVPSVCDIDNPCPKTAYCDCSNTTLSSKGTPQGQCVQWANSDCGPVQERYIQCLSKFGCPNSVWWEGYSALVPGSCAHHCKKEFQLSECCRRYDYEDTVSLRDGMECPPMSQIIAADMDPLTVKKWTPFNASVLAMLGTGVVSVAGFVVFAIYTKRKGAEYSERAPLIANGP